VAVLIAVMVYGLMRDRDPATLNNVSFAGLHVVVLLAGILPALRRRPLPAASARPSPAPA
jgi:hypothetical protein